MASDKKLMFNGKEVDNFLPVSDEVMTQLVREKPSELSWPEFADEVLKRGMEQ